jgi:hypothetical protein
MSAIKATAYAFPFLFALTSPSYASIHDGGFHGAGFHGPSAFRGGAFNRGNFHGVARDRFWPLSAPFTISRIIKDPN